MLDGPAGEPGHREPHRCIPSYLTVTRMERLNGCEASTNPEGRICFSPGSIAEVQRGVTQAGCC